jgi:hypothetical protein
MKDESLPPQELFFILPPSSFILSQARVAKRLRRRIADPVFVSSSLTACSKTNDERGTMNDELFIVSRSSFIIIFRKEVPGDGAKWPSLTA